MPDHLYLRDALFLLAHDEDHAHRPRIHPTALSLGLAGATLLDLLLPDRLRLRDQRVTITDLYDHRPTGDPITDHTLALVRATRGSLPPREMITRLAPDLYDRTRGGLLAAGILTRTRRRLGRDHYQPTNPALIARIRGMVRAAVQGTDPHDPHTDALCALIRVLGLHDTLYLPDTPTIDAALHHITARLRQAPGSWADIPSAVDAALGDLTVAVYR